MKNPTEASCVVCGYDNPDAIERHHISREPDLTIPICRNCHRIITKYEKGWLVFEGSLKLIHQYEACKATILYNIKHFSFT